VSGNVRDLLISRCQERLSVRRSFHDALFAPGNVSRFWLLDVFHSEPGLRGDDRPESPPRRRNLRDPSGRASCSIASQQHLAASKPFRECSPASNCPRSFLASGDHSASRSGTAGRDCSLAAIAVQLSSAVAAAAVRRFCSSAAVAVQEASDARGPTFSTHSFAVRCRKNTRMNWTVGVAEASSLKTRMEQAKALRSLESVGAMSRRSVCGNEAARGLQAF